MGAVSRSFRTVKGTSGAQSGDVRLFSANPGPGWVAEDGSVPYEARREGILLANTLGGFQVVGSPFSAGALAGMSRIGNRIFAWQGSVVAYTDDGEAWTIITNSMFGQNSGGGIGGIVVFKGLLILTMYSNQGEVRTSSDGGATFTTRVSTGGGTIKGIFEVDGALYILTNVGIYRSEDGISWTQLTSSQVFDLTVTSKYIIVSGHRGLSRALRSTPTSWTLFYSPNNDYFQAVYADDDDSVYTAYSNVILKGPPDGGQSTTFQEVARVPEIGSIYSMARIDGLFTIGSSHVTNVGASLRTTKDFLSYDVATTMSNASSAQGVRRIYKAGQRVLIGGESFQRGGVATHRGIPIARRPNSKRSAKAYTRL